MIQKFIGSVFTGKLEEMCKTDQGTLSAGALIVLAGYLVSQLISLAGQLVSNPFALTIIWASLLLIGVAMVLGVILAILFHALIYFIATIVFKGTGTLDQQFYIASFPWATIQVIQSIIMLPAVFFPNIICMLAIPSFALTLYQFYLLYIVVKNVHGLSSTNAAVSILLGIVVGAIIYFVVALLLVMLALGSILALAGSGAGGITHALVGI